jgi:hypothetical protein
MAAGLESVYGDCFMAWGRILAKLSPWVGNLRNKEILNDFSWHRS